MLNKHEVVSGAVEVNQAYKEHKLAICGYPLAGRFTCSPLTNAKNYLFGFSATGFGYPGMSGGPVLDLNTGKVIGVTSAVAGEDPQEESRTILAPTIEVWKALHISED